MGLFFYATWHKHRVCFKRNKLIILLANYLILSYYISVNKGNNMSENKNVIQKYKGKITCNRSILLSIIDLATREICGVSGLASSFKSKISSVFSKNKNPSVRVRFNANGSLSVDVYVRLFYGYSVPDIAYKIQENIKNGISAMIDMRATRVNVHVMGVDFENDEPISA